MTAAKKEEEALFTCLTTSEQFVRVRASNLEEADRLTDYESIVIIGGTDEAVGAKRIDSDGISGLTFSEFTRSGIQLQPGDRCTFTVCDPVRFEDVVYRGDKPIGEDGNLFLSFEKNGTLIWACVDGHFLRFSSINGRALGAPAAQKA